MSKHIKPKLNKYHVIVDPNLHDGELTKIEILPEKEMKVVIENNSASYEFLLKEVQYFWTSSFRGRNIVFDVTVLKGIEYPETKLIKLLEPGPEINDTYIKNTLKAIFEGALTLFIVSPSYGCELICLCSSYSIFKL